MWSHANLQPRVSQSFNFQYLSDNSENAALWAVSSISPPLINVSLVSLFHIESTPILVMSAWQRHFWIYIIIYFKFHYSQTGHGWIMFTLISLIISKKIGTCDR